MMNNRPGSAAHGHLRQPNDEALGKMRETSLELIVKSDATEQGLQQDESGMGRQPLIFEESQFRKPIDAGVNLCFAGFHI